MPETTVASRKGGPAPPRLADRPSMRLVVFVAGLVLALIGGFGLGRLTATSATPPAGAAGDPARPGEGADHIHPPGNAPHDHRTGGTATAPADAEVGGLALSAGNLTLLPAVTSFTAGARQDFRFQVQGVDRRPVTSFAVVHDKPMHLIVVRRDLSGYQHLHPAMAPDGTWSVPLTLPEPGVWRAYADFTAVDPAGAQTAVTLGVDLVADGAYAPRPLPAAAREAEVDDFTVAYQGTPQTGATQPLLFRVSQNGSPVAGLERYLGAYGHLVVLREGDLGYLHVHPEEQLVDGAAKFWLAAPSPGRYRMFFDFQVSGALHTAEFTVVVE